MACGGGLLSGMLPADRPRERLARLGPRALMDEELFALLIGTGTKGSPVQQVSQALLNEAGSLATMATWEAADFARVRGLGPAKAAELSAVMELARRIRERAQDPGEKLDAPVKVWARMEPLAAGLAVEKCWVLCLNRRNRLLALHEVSSGTATSALLHPREVFREAIAERAAAVTPAVTRRQVRPTAPSPGN